MNDPKSSRARPPKKPERPSVGSRSTSIYDAYDTHRYASLERKLAADPKAWLETEDFITALVRF